MYRRRYYYISFFVLPSCSNIKSDKGGVMPSKNGCDRPPARPPKRTPRDDNSARVVEVEPTSGATRRAMSSADVRTMARHKIAATNPAAVAPRNEWKKRCTGYSWWIR